MKDVPHSGIHYDFFSLLRFTKTHSICLMPHPRFQELVILNRWFEIFQTDISENATVSGTIP